MDIATLDLNLPLHLVIHGRVQGVGFREGMVTAAIGLEARGWVRNRLDGTVEAIVQGTPAARAALVRWAHRGPLGARVERVDVRAAAVDAALGLPRAFERRPTA